MVRRADRRSPERARAACRRPSRRNRRRADQLLAAARVFESLDHGGDARALGAFGRRHRADHPKTRQRCRVRNDIDEIGDRQPSRCDQQSADRGPGDHADAAAHDRERGGRGQFVLLDEARNQRLDRWPLQSADGGHPRRNQIQLRRGRAPGCDDDEGRAAGGERHVGEDRNTTSIHGIGHDAADERGGEKRNELDESEETH
jgi:hypothetical protein